MYKRLFLSLAAAFLVIGAFLLTPFAGQTGLFSLFLAGPSYSIDSMSVYLSDSNVIGSGNAVCTAVGISGISASCDVNLLKSGIYRFEFTVSNSGSKDGSPDQPLFLNAFAAGDVLGSDANLLYCGCLDDGTYKKGFPSFVADDVNCNLAGNPCLVEKTGGSETFYYVIGIGSNAATGTGSFYINDQEESQNDLSAEISFGYCIPACDSNAACADSNSLTIDSCSNPGTCSAACSNVPCTIACNSNSECDDSNSSTVDSCSNPGTCSAACSNSCVVACSSDAACNDSNSLTIDTCLLPGSCSSSCSHSLCAIACSSNAACSDSNSLTIDTCSNAGTCSSVCLHSSCTVACSSNLDCDDSDAETIDTCNNAGTCDANCTSAICTPACNSDSECNDSDAETKDTCIHPGACGAHCLHDYCVPECYSNEGCGDGNPLTIDTCVDAGECNASCSNKPCPIACSSDSDCDDSELATRDFCSNAGTCLAKCSHEEQRAFVFEFASDFNSIGRGSLVDLNVLVKDLNGNAVEGASIYAVDSAGRRIDLNGVGLGRYFAVYEVPAGFAIGVQKLSFLASKGGFVGVEEIVLNVLKGNIDAILLEPAEPRVIAGQNIELRFRLAYGDGSPVADGNAGALMNDVSIELALDSNGFFTGSYLFSEADLNGAVLVISSSDSLGNEGLTEIAFSVQNPIPLVSIAVGILIAIALLVAAYVFRRTRRLSGILHRVRRLEKESKGTRLKHAIEKEKGAREKLAKRIEKQEKELVLLRQEAEAERKKQTLAVQRIPIESRYAVHEAAFGFRAGIGKLFSRAPKKSAERLKAEKRLLEIDSEIEALDAKVKALEESYVKKGLKEEDFKKKLFDLREKSHLLELEKKKIE